MMLIFPLIVLFFFYVWDGTCLKLVGKVKVDTPFRLRLLGAELGAFVASVGVDYVVSLPLSQVYGPYLRVVVVFAVAAAVVRAAVLYRWFGRSRAAAITAAAIPSLILMGFDQWFGNWRTFG